MFLDGFWGYAEIKTNFTNEEITPLNFDNDEPNTSTVIFTGEDGQKKTYTFNDTGRLKDAMTKYAEDMLPNYLFRGVIDANEINRSTQTPDPQMRIYKTTNEATLYGRVSKTRAIALISLITTAYLWSNS